jgi:hypothetical protein
MIPLKFIKKNGRPPVYEDGLFELNIAQIICAGKLEARPF